jgi:hypothetical protein
MANRSEIPYDHFSILNEMVFAVIAPLESRGYSMPDKRYLLLMVEAKRLTRN